MKRLLTLIAIVQAILAAGVFIRVARTANGSRIELSPEGNADLASVTVIVPVLDEIDRLGPCLDGLIRQGCAVAEILVVDGGSLDGTRFLVEQYRRLDPRIRFIDAAPIPEGVNGKAHGLQRGFEASRPDTRWILAIDADVRPAANVVPSLLRHAEAHGVRALSAATQQRLDGALLGLLHPAMLTSLVYRYGIPGHATASVDQVQSNGQCFLVDRTVLERAGGFGTTLDSVCEDVTLARAIASTGERVGFYESDDLVAVEMYRSGAEAWRNWPRSLPMRDRFSGPRSAVGLAELIFVQALPLWLMPITWRKAGMRSPVTQLQLGLFAGRLGVLLGTSRAYRQRPWSYWLSPLFDLPVTLRIMQMAFRTTHSWRGRTFETGKRL